MKHLQHFEKFNESDIKSCLQTLVDDYDFEVVKDNGTSYVLLLEYPEELDIVGVSTPILDDIKKSLKKINTEFSIQINVSAYNSEDKMHHQVKVPSWINSLSELDEILYDVYLKHIGSRWTVHINNYAIAVYW